MSPNDQAALRSDTSLRQHCEKLLKELQHLHAESLYAEDRRKRLAQAIDDVRGLLVRLPKGEAVT